MKKIPLLCLLLSLTFTSVTLAALPFTGKENQDVIIENQEICVPENSPYWKEGYPCCDGLAPYLPSNIEGQLYCAPFKEVFVDKYIFSLAPWVHYSLGMVVLVFLISYFRKRRSHRSIKK